MNRAPDNAEELRELRRACPRVAAAAAGAEREGGYGHVRRTFEPCIRLVEGEQETAVQGGGDSVEGFRHEDQ